MYYLKKKKNFLLFYVNIHFFSSDRDYEDKPFEEEDLPTGFDSDHSDDDEEDNNWSDWRGNLSGNRVLERDSETKKYKMNAETISIHITILTCYLHIFQERCVFSVLPIIQI